MDIMPIPRVLQSGYNIHFYSGDYVVSTESNHRKENSIYFNPSLVRWGTRGNCSNHSEILEHSGVGVEVGGVGLYKDRIKRLKPASPISPNIKYM